MKREKWIDICASFSELFELLSNSKSNNASSKYFTCHELEKIEKEILMQKNYNGWFTEEIMRQALSGLKSMLNKEDLNKWIKEYAYAPTPKKILVIMAGNIPLVGFHDLICIWFSGNFAKIKLSSDDQTLLPLILDVVAEIHPELKDFYSFESGKITESEAVIATGGDNSNLYFEKYFGHLPCLFRKNRTSIAIIEGSETQEELTNLGKDIFSFYGKGCRNVSYLLIPKNYDLDILFEALLPYHQIIQNKKYGNNYDYNRALNLLNQVKFLDNNFLMLKESEMLFSPISMLHYKRFKDESEIKNFIKLNSKDIQIVLGREFIPFGFGQNPRLWDYADGKDTMDWLGNLS
ncbi:MAG: acyl-CoA reductase [Bacteroidota bacterium]